jgi:hypothetical protein
MKGAKLLHNLFSDPEHVKRLRDSGVHGSEISAARRLIPSPIERPIDAAIVGREAVIASDVIDPDRLYSAHDLRRLAHKILALADRLDP